MSFLSDITLTGSRSSCTRWHKLITSNLLLRYAFCGNNSYTKVVRILFLNESKTSKSSFLNGTTHFSIVWKTRAAFSRPYRVDFIKLKFQTSSKPVIFRRVKYRLTDREHISFHCGENEDDFEMLRNATTYNKIHALHNACPSKPVCSFLYKKFLSCDAYLGSCSRWSGYADHPVYRE